MTRKVALDWDEQQIRMVVGTSAGRQTRVTDAAIVPIGEDGLAASLKKLVQAHGLEKTECLIAVGRDQAELRQMDFPPVPDKELPDMVRFQAIRTFASAGDSATVDFLQTERREDGISAIVSATGPAKLDPIRKAVTGAGLNIDRVALRPIAAAALFQILGREKTSQFARSTLALIDLVADEAEIVLFRGNDIVFVRSVRLPEEPTARVNALAGELRRSMMACGAGSTNCDIVMWGTEKRHEGELNALAQKLNAGQNSDSKTAVMDPFDLVISDPSVEAGVGETVGRLAPLVGLLVADQGFETQLIDFNNPRETVEPSTDKRKVAAMVGIPAAIVLVGLWGLWSQFRSLDSQITAQETANAELRTQAKTAEKSIDRTKEIDAFLDGDVNWLEEIERLAVSIPPAEQLIVKQISGFSNPREGGGRLVVAGQVTGPDVIDKMESALRDEKHGVVGDGASQLDTKDAYRWRMRETISLTSDVVQADRYARILAAAEATNDEADATEDESVDTPSTESEPATSTESEPAQAPNPSPDSQTKSTPALPKRIGGTEIQLRLSASDRTPNKLNDDPPIPAWQAGGTGAEVLS